MFEGRKILVTGGTGFLGGALARELLRLGGEVRATCWSRAGSFNHERLEWVCADLREEEPCRRAVAGMDYVFHCAGASSGAADIISTPLMHVTPNVVMNARLLEVAYLGGVKKFLFLSSGTAYPPRGDHPLREDELFDGDPADVYYPVGWMKRYTETLCRMYGEKLKRSMPTLVIRPSNVYGPGDKFDWQRSHVTAALVRRVVERHRPIVVWGTGGNLRDLIYIDDFVAGVFGSFALTAPFLIINIASGRSYSIKDVLRTALAVDRFDDAEVQFDPTKPSTIDKLVFDIGLAKRLFGFDPATSLEEGLGKTMQWLRENPPSG